jgi:hypothetical protein
VALAAAVAFAGDHSIIEAFAQGGREAVTSRIYPLTKPATAGDRDSIVSIAPWGGGLFVESSCGEAVHVSGEVAAYELGSCWIDPPRGQGGE